MIDLAHAAARIVTIYVQYHPVTDITGLIKAVAQALEAPAEFTDQPPPPPPSDIWQPADPPQQHYSAPAQSPNPFTRPPGDPIIPPRRSVFADHIVCLHCGTKLRRIARHLYYAHDQRPTDYRRHFKLRKNYPLVVPAAVPKLPRPM